MHLKVLLPDRVLVDAPVGSVSAEAPSGSFTMLPEHIDFVSPLVPGILAFREPVDGGRERFVAIDDGILVKRGSEVLVSTRRGVESDHLLELRQVVAQEFQRRSESERLARIVLARLETTFMKRFVELE